MPVGRPALFNNPEELQSKVDEYLNHKDHEWIVTETAVYQKEPITITGLAYYLGFESRQSFYDYEKHDEYSYIIKKARLKVESEYEAKLSRNNPTGSIFALKNMGWKDKTEQEITGVMPVIWKEEKTYREPVLNGSNGHS
jgi:hypothetical protein